MQYVKAHVPVAVFNLVYIAGFSAWFIANGNYEFLWYISVLIAIAVAIATTLPKTGFPNWLLWLLSFWGLFHLAGGGVRVGDGVLYGMMVWPILDRGGDFVLFKYDQLVHAYGFGVAALAMCVLLERAMARTSRWWIGVVAVLSSMGLSAANEIVEFIPVVLLPHTWVGDYYNVALDLVFNTLGAIAAAVGYAHIARRDS